MSITAVIFDMDGVLIDARDWHYEALNDALRLFGHDISRAEHLSRFDGLPTRQKLSILSEERGLPRSLHAFINQLKQQYTLEIVQRRLKSNFRHEYALSRLKREGYTVGVASNSIRSTIEVMMQRSCLSPYLDFMLSNEDVVHGKPSPEIYIKAISRAAAQPTQVLVVEDNPHGIAAAVAAGANVLRVDSVDDVNYRNIRKFIDQLNENSAQHSQRKAA